MFITALQLRYTATRANPRRYALIHGKQGFIGAESAEARRRCYSAEPVFRGYILAALLINLSLVGKEGEEETEIEKRRVIKCIGDRNKCRGGVSPSLCREKSWSITYFSLDIFNARAVTRARAYVKSALFANKRVTIS